MRSDRRTKNAPVYLFENTAHNNYQILISTMLSARTKDSTTIPIVNRMFKRIKRPVDIVKMSEKEIEKIIYGIGFYRTKAKYLKKMAEKLIEEFNGIVPGSLEKLLSLSGVGRKTANIVLARAFGKKTIGVDVHVHRITNRLGLVRTKKPEDTERRLMHFVPKKYLRDFNRIFVAYGQTICLPRNPKCTTCKLNEICPKIGVRRVFIVR